jgi:hypothetical protein
MITDPDYITHKQKLPPTSTADKKKDVNWASSAVSEKDKFIKSFDHLDAETSRLLLQNRPLVDQLKGFEFARNWPMEVLSKRLQKGVYIHSFFQLCA